MLMPARTIWDTRIQCVCGVVTASSAYGVEAFMCANFAQVSLDPLRVAINPNRLYPIESAIRKAGTFAINVMPESRLTEVKALNDIRRRQVGKVGIAGLECAEGEHGIPYLPAALQTVFCQVEQVLDTGDHSLVVARVLAVHESDDDANSRPLLYSSVTAGSRLGTLARRLMSALGLMDGLRRLKWRLRPPVVPDLPRATYIDGGQTEHEIATVLDPGAIDTGRVIQPGRPVRPGRVRLGLCIVGAGWGAEHARFARRAWPQLDLYLCGRDEQRTARLAGRLGAAGWFTDIEAAAEDSRVQALTVALPHDQHRRAVEIAASRGKHVLVEKPIATTLEDADAMIAAANAADTLLMVAEDMHFRPAVREAVRQIESGLVGEPVYLLVHVAGMRRPLGWKADPARAGGGVWMDQGVHYVRAVRLLMGEPDRVLATRGMQVHTKGEAEDSLQVLLSSCFGWQAHVFASWIANRGPLPDMVVHGEKGVLHLYPGRPFLDFFPNAPTGLSRALSYVRPYSLQERLRRPWQQRRRISLRDEDLTGYVHEMREFLSAVAEGRPLVTPAADGRRDLEVVLAGYESLERVAWVESGISHATRGGPVDTSGLRDKSR
jgi:predicted dehydrogenase/flavin reductase (DIM6/NTAB) family NADH-FMN oxidoreductase RutF